MSEKIIDDKGNVYVETKPWYKRWWVWIVIIAVLLVLFTIIAGSSDSSSSSSKSGKVAANQPVSLEIDYDNYKVKDSKIYDSNYTNSDWNNATVKINKITVYKLSKTYKFDSDDDGKININGFVKFNMTIKAHNDISVYPEQGTINFGSQQSTSADESWDGDMNEGAKKSGVVYFPIKDLKTVESLKTLRFKFSGNNQDDFSKGHDYDINLNLSK
ncbi:MULTISPECIES: hypothetical protein [unclassified Lactobacillus]|uniref:hypothetical protein n=1 Tax=unclassified Lactobacillus TaxID=2620435 RepID=UPI000EFC6D15|nr:MULTISPECIES: hypothetical protein [unclassified Lactobacillus]RMC42356.1 hypothetical protein F5ESL0237_00145 [Lactobacillus sp. ESL0237]RMC45691.1 hypothetical protein F5ESL0234_00145 [Lactobacillus sp. ESL0234]RMC47152.1 hypothetical protein F5ESL0236_00145 [Lactobacillus sp. ESL0236]RMC52158.1 hypothetical protein F5ESL0225_00110 [Lactobacillus sp. ESL0225]